MVENYWGWRVFFRARSVCVDFRTFVSRCFSGGSDEGAESSHVVAEIA